MPIISYFLLLQRYTKRLNVQNVSNLNCYFS
nr:MAG TPA: hypothetical protein [Caudoviricetes sp.]